jgi:hypothetical protein
MSTTHDNRMPRISPQLTSARLNAVARMLRAGFSLRELAERSHARLGYESPNVCHHALYATLKRFGFAVRDSDRPATPPLRSARPAAGTVENTALREAFRRSGLTAHEVARRAHFVYSRKADNGRVMRLLGLAERNRDNRWPQRAPGYVSVVGAPAALALSTALGADPVDVGL